MKLSNDKPPRARPHAPVFCVVSFFKFLIIYSSFFFFFNSFLFSSLMAHNLLGPSLVFCLFFFFHHKKIFHIIEIHNHCESSYEYRKMFGGIFHQCFMIIKMVHPQSFSQHIASTRHSQDVIRNFIQNRRRFFLILQDWEMWKYEKNSVNKMELFMKK